MHSNTPARIPKQPLRIVLVGDQTATAPKAGLTSCSCSPVLDVCRQLIGAGYAPETPAVAYRDGIKALLLKSIGSAAALQVNGHGTAFIALRGWGPASPVRQTAEPQGEACPRSEKQTEVA
jgi:hypothetical protein